MMRVNRTNTRLATEWWMVLQCLLSLLTDLGVFESCSYFYLFFLFHVFMISSYAIFSRWDKAGNPTQEENWTQCVGKGITNWLNQHSETRKEKKRKEKKRKMEKNKKRRQLDQMSPVHFYSLQSLLFSSTAQARVERNSSNRKRN